MPEPQGPTLTLPGTAEWPYPDDWLLVDLIRKYNVDQQDAGSGVKIDLERSAPRKVRAAIGGAPLQAQYATLKNYYDYVEPIYYEAKLPDPGFRKTSQTPPIPRRRVTNYIVKDKDGTFHLVNPPGIEKESIYGLARPTAEGTVSAVYGLVPPLRGTNIALQLLGRGTLEGLGGVHGRVAYDTAAAKLLKYEDPRTPEQKQQEQLGIFGMNAFLGSMVNAPSAFTKQATKYGLRAGAPRRIVGENLDQMRRLTGGSGSLGLVTGRSPIKAGELVLMKYPWSQETMQSSLVDFIETWGQTIKNKLFPMADDAIRETRARYPSHSEAGRAIREGIYGRQQEYRSVTGRPRPKEGGWRQAQQYRDAILYGKFESVYPEDTLVSPNALIRLRNQLAAQPEGNQSIIRAIDGLLSDYGPPRIPDIGAPPARGGAPQPGMGRPLTGQVNRPGMGPMNVPATQPPGGRIPSSPGGLARGTLGQPQPHPGIPYKDYKSFRSIYGDRLSTTELAKNLTDEQRRMLYSAVSEDIVSSIAHVNPADRSVGRRALEYWRHAELNHKRAMQLEEEVYKKVADRFSDARIYNTFKNLAKGENADPDAIKAIWNVLDGEQQDIVLRNLLMDIGWSADDKIWSPTQLFSNWHQYDAAVKDAIMPRSGRHGELREAYDQMADLVARTGISVRMTQTPAFVESALVAPAAAVAVGGMKGKFLLGAFTALTFMKGPRMVAHLVNSPKFMDWVVSTANSLPSMEHPVEATFEMLMTSFATLGKVVNASKDPTELAALGYFSDSFLNIVDRSLDAVIDPITLLEQSKRGPARPEDIRVNPEAILLGGGR